MGEDHEELSDPAAGSWSALSAAHRDLTTIDPKPGEFDSQGDVPPTTLLAGTFVRLPRSPSVSMFRDLC